MHMAENSFRQNLQNVNFCFIAVCILKISCRPSLLTPIVYNQSIYHYKHTSLSILPMKIRRFFLQAIVTHNQIIMSTEKVEKCSPQEVAEKIKVYSIRWLILGIFVAYSASSAIQWIQYSIISDVVTKYYDINSTIVDWTSMIYMVLYIVFVFPASYIMEHWVSLFS